MTESTDAKLAEIFTVVLEPSPGTDVTKMRRMAEPRWDSLAHVSIVAAIESVFGLSLEVADMERLSSFDAARLLLEEKGV